MVSRLPVVMCYEVLEILLKGTEEQRKVWLERACQEYANARGEDALLLLVRRYGESHLVAEPVFSDDSKPERPVVYFGAGPVYDGPYEM